MCLTWVLRQHLGSQTALPTCALTLSPQTTQQDSSTYLYMTLALYVVPSGPALPTYT